MGFLIQLSVGSLLIAATVIIHIMGIVGLIRFISSWIPRLGSRTSYVGMLELLTLTVIALFLLHTLEIWIWAVFYMLCGEFTDLGRALYFSTVTFSTLGYGDITLTDRWRLVSSFEAVNGVILFGISTAFVFAVIQRIYATVSKDPEQ